MEESKKKSDFFAIFIASLRENRNQMFFLFWIISGFLFSLLWQREEILTFSNKNI